MLAAKRRSLSRESRSDLIAIAIPVLVGALLCALELNTRSLWLDEGATFAITSQHGAALWHGIKNDGGNMLLYYLLIHAVGALFGHAAWVMRLPSLLAIAATGGLVAAIGLRLLSDRRQAVAGGLLTVISLPLVFWGQDARGYALMLALATASMLAFIVMLDGSPSRAAPLAFVLTTVAALYVGYDAGLLILVQLAALPLFRERVRLVIGSLVVVALLCIPLLILALERGSGQLFWVPPLSGSVLGQTTMTLLSAGMPPNFHENAGSVVTEIVSGLLMIAAVTLAVRADRWLRLLVAWLLIPAAVGFAVSAAGKPIELARCSILLMPALSLLLVWLLARATLPRGAGVATFAVLIALRVLQIVPSYGTSPEDWKAATSAVLTSMASQPACIAFYPQDGREVFDYYLERSAGGRMVSDATQRLTPVLPTLEWGTVRPFVEQYRTLNGGPLAAVEQRCAVLYLLASHIGQSSGPAVSRAHLARYDQLLQALATAYPVHSSRKFGWAAPVYVARYSR
jgi:Dolichyl-phosphate-mannose-protein mannosyltransferase